MDDFTTSCPIPREKLINKNSRYLKNDNKANPIILTQDHMQQ
jgi:hypothetical protein